MNSTQEHRSIFAEVLNGLTVTKHSSIGNVFIKHLSYIENGELEIRYFEFLDTAQEKGFKTYAEKQAQIIDDGFWTTKDESNLQSEEEFIKTLRNNLSKDFLKSRRDTIRKEIKECEHRIQAFKIKKDFYIGETAEQWANKSLTYYKILNCYFKDKKLTQPFEEKELEDDEIYFELIRLYNDYQQRVSYDNLKKIALSPFFTNIFYLAPEDTYAFYGKAIIHLTNHQAELSMLGRYFKNILSEYGNKIPVDIKNNPEDLIEFVEIQSNAKEARVIGDEESENGGNKAIVGATTTDLKMLGLNITKNDKFNKKLKEKGMLTQDDLLGV